MEQINADSQVAWNLSSSLIQEIGLLLNSASRYYLGGNAAKWFHTLVAIKMRVIQNLSKTERAKFTVSEIKIGLLLKSVQKNRGACYGAIVAYNELIMDVLEKYGFLFSKKKDGKRVM